MASAVASPASGTDVREESKVAALTQIALMLIPGALVVYMGFNAGGYFPIPVAVAALVLSQILLARVMLAVEPFAGVAASAACAILALAAFAILTIVSGAWSHSPGRALLSYDRVYLYLVILTLMATVRAGRGDLRWLIRGLVLGIAIVCLAGLVSRVLPDVLHTEPDLASERLSYPVTYWNALGVLAAMGVVLAFHLSCDLEEHPLVRTIAAGLGPLLAATLFFTFSRGSLAAVTIGIVLYVVLARPAGLLSGALACGPASAILLVVAYDANLLDSVDPKSPAAQTQGHHVALVAILCAAGAVILRLLLNRILDPDLQRLAARRHMGRQTRRMLIAGTVLAALLLALALHVPRKVEHDAKRFMSAASPTTGTDLRGRLGNVSNNGRTPLWRVAWHAFEASTAHGYGAGTYQTLWLAKRKEPQLVVNAHSLYLETMAELGIPGITLLLLALGAVFVGLARRMRGRRRVIYGALFAVSATWALHAGVDWDWQMPVITLPVFAIAGAALSPRTRAPRRWIPSPNTRILLGLLCLLSAAVPVLTIGSQVQLNKAKQDLYGTRDCTAGASAAVSSIGWLDMRAEPYEVLGYCDLERGHPRAGVEAMQQAVREDPQNWETYFALAIAKAAAGIDPRPDARRARRMNPYEPLARRATLAFDGADRAEWVRLAPVVRSAALTSNDLQIAPS